MKSSVYFPYISCRGQQEKKINKGPKDCCSRTMWVISQVEKYRKKYEHIMLTLLFLLWSLIRGLRKPLLPTATNTNNTMSTTPSPAEEPPNDPSPSPERVTYSPSPEPEFLSEMSTTRVSTDSYRSRYFISWLEGMLCWMVSNINIYIYNCSVMV